MSPQQDEVHIHKLELESNCYVVSCTGTREALLIDASSGANQILEALQGLEVKYIVITHTHGDHLGSLAEVRAAIQAPVAVHAAEADRLPVPAERLLQDGDTLAFGNCSARVIHVPGHTPGSICLLVGRHLLAGDTLFPGGPGHTRTPADLHQTIQSITQRIYTLPDDTVIHSGHGPGTTVGESKREYALFAQKSHPADLCGDVLWLSR